MLTGSKMVSLDKKLLEVELFTDGACSGNPGPGGWGVVMRCDGLENEFSGGESHTTNNRMELLAAIKGLEALSREAHVHIYTDSTYLRNGITTWIHKWKKNQWRTSGKRPVKNIDLWKRLEQALANHVITWYWVRGHSGHPGNERADDLARMAVP